MHNIRDQGLEGSAVGFARDGNSDLRGTGSGGDTTANKIVNDNPTSSGEEGPSSIVLASASNTDMVGSGPGSGSSAGNSDQEGKSAELGTVIYFPPQEYEKAAIYDTNRGIGSAVFPYRVSNNYLDQNVSIRAVAWKTQKDSSTYDTSAKVELTDTDRSGTARADHYLFDVSKQTASLNLTEIKTAADVLNKISFFSIEWAMGNSTTGATNSPFFVVGTGDRNKINEMNQGLTKDQVETTDKPATPSVTGSPNDGSSKASGGGGMSTGAIVGAAVGGAVGGLLFVGIIIWFLLRKRRQKRHSSVTALNTQQQSSNTFMVDKETHGRGDDSPASPYSEDNVINLNSNINSNSNANANNSYGNNLTQPARGNDWPLPNVGAANTSHQERDLPDLPRDRDLPRTSTGGSGPEGHGRSTNVAHLVEEGMTPEEIRRLEEEERQLDAEIERAARR